MAKYYTFHYAKTGARAITGEYNEWGFSKKDILNIGCKLSKEKGRSIAIKQHDPGWVKESAYIVAKCDGGRVTYCILFI